MTKVKINLYINENDPVNDTTVGIALGKAIVRSELTYEEDITPEEVNRLQTENKKLREALEFYAEIEQARNEWGWAREALKELNEKLQIK